MQAFKFAQTLLHPLPVQGRPLPRTRSARLGHPPSLPGGLYRRGGRPRHRQPHAGAAQAGKPPDPIPFRDFPTPTLPLPLTPLTLLSSPLPFPTPLPPRFMGWLRRRHRHGRSAFTSLRASPFHRWRSSSPRALRRGRPTSPSRAPSPSSPLASFRSIRPQSRPTAPSTRSTRRSKGSKRLI